MSKTQHWSHLTGRTLHTTQGAPFDVVKVTAKNVLVSAQVVTDYADRHRIARPYKKNEQAFIECFNGTLRREEFGHTPFKASELELAQQRANAYLDYYHNKRPHLALDMMTPSKFAESHLR